MPWASHVAGRQPDACQQSCPPSRVLVHRGLLTAATFVAAAQPEHQALGSSCCQITTCVVQACSHCCLSTVGHLHLQCHGATNATSHTFCQHVHPVRILPCCWPRPKVTTPGSDVDVSDLDDVQRLYIILDLQQPAGGKCRLLVVAKKRLPDTKKHERFFAFVGRCTAGPPLNAMQGPSGRGVPPMASWALRVIICVILPARHGTCLETF